MVPYKDRYTQTLLGALPYRKQMFGFEFWPRCKTTFLTTLTRKQTDKQQQQGCECPLYCLVYREQHQHTDDMTSAHLKNFCMNTAQLI